MLVLFTPLVRPSRRTPQSSITVFSVIMSLMIIDRNQLQPSECDISSPSPLFHPAGLSRDPTSFEYFCGLWLTEGNTCLTAVHSQTACLASLQDFCRNWLTDRTSVVKPCSPETSPGDIWPQYTSLLVSEWRPDAQHSERKAIVTGITTFVRKIFCHNQICHILGHVDLAACEHTNITLHGHEEKVQARDALMHGKHQDGC